MSIKCDLGSTKILDLGICYSLITTYLSTNNCNLISILIVIDNPYQ